MKKYQHGWLRFCCFLTGYNFYILSNCSEISTRKVKRYAAALFIIATIWAFVGFCFSNRYIKLDFIGSVVGAIISVFIVIQIERQILLADKSNRWVSASRIIIGLMMAVLGSMIVDQIIFKDDIDKAKIAANQEQVQKLLPEKASEINMQINEYNQTLAIKEQERKELLDEVNRRPTIKIVETTTTAVPVTNTAIDSLGKQIVTRATETSKTANVRVVENPKMAQLKSVDIQIESLNKQKAAKEDMLLNIKSVLEEEVSQKVGFLDELNIMLQILKQSTLALFVYFLWLFFLLFLELLILLGKLNDTDSDYDKIIQKQMAIHLRKVELL